MFGAAIVKMMERDGCGDYTKNDSASEVHIESSSSSKKTELLAAALNDSCVMVELLLLKRELACARRVRHCCTACLALPTSLSHLLARGVSLTDIERTR